MKKSPLLVLSTLIMFSAIMPAMASPTPGEVWPMGCGGLFNKCEGWMFHYYAKPDANGHVDVRSGMDQFISNKDAANIDIARTLADQVIANISTQR